MQINQDINTPNKQNSNSSDSSQNEIDFDPDSPNQKFFNLSQVKPLDLKSQWLGNTHEVLNKFEIKLAELKIQKQNLNEGFKQFKQNQNRFKISSLRKINFHMDKKQIYKQFMLKSRKTVQKLHPSLVINILSYTDGNVFKALAKIRRVSKIFNLIYLNQNVVKLFSQKDFGLSNVSLTQQQKWCIKYVNFCSTFLYYKQIKYTEIIPQNSTKQDLQQAINFINDIYKWTYQLKNIQFGYFQLINRFMRQHRVVLALQALSFAELAVVRRASVIAFSNYLAFNSDSRKKQQITKTKYLKMIQLIQNQYYRDSLILNSKVSNFLQQQYGYKFSVFIDTLRGMPILQFSQWSIFDLVLFHNFNQLKSFMMKQIEIKQQRIQIKEVTFQFQQLLKSVQLSYFIGQRWKSQLIQCQYLPYINQSCRFGHSLVYRGSDYFVILILKNQLKQN